MESSAKLVALLTALLPAAGVVTRYVALNAGTDVPSPWLIAWSAPLAQLVVTGAFGLVPAALTFILLFGLSGSWPRLRLAEELTKRVKAFEEERFSARAAAAALGEKIASSDGHQMTPELALEADELNHRLGLLEGKLQGLAHDASSLVGSQKVPQGRFGTLLALTAPVFLLGEVVFLPDWPAGLAVLPAGLLLAFIRPMARRVESLSIARIWPIVVGVLLYAAVITGLAGSLTGVTPSDYIFAPVTASTVKNGTYALLGSADQLLYLQQCDGGRVVSVNSASVVNALPRSRATLRSGPSAWAILVDGTPVHLGLQPGC